VKYFREVASIMGKLNKPITWVTPAGMIISQKYTDFESKRIKTSLLKASKPITISLPIADSVNIRTQSQAFSPNFVHSLDASHIYLLVSRFKESIPLYTIHDCFASNLTHMEYLNKEVREAFIELYFSKNYLAEFEISFLTQLNSYTTVVNRENGTCFIVIGDKEFEIPQLPKIEWETKRINWINSIRLSRYLL
jgi:DNA-directed RNA polymerase